MPMVLQSANLAVLSCLTGISKYSFKVLELAVNSLVTSVIADVRITVLIFCK